MTSNVRYEEQMERRQEALDRRYSRQQYELDLYGVDAALEAETPCPNCGEIGYEPVYGVSEDLSVGYSCEEQGCTACLDTFMGRAK